MAGEYYDSRADYKSGLACDLLFYYVIWVVAVNDAK